MSVDMQFKLPVGGSCVGNTEVVGLGIGVGEAAGKLNTVIKQQTQKQ